MGWLVLHLERWHPGFLFEEIKEERKRGGSSKKRGGSSKKREGGPKKREGIPKKREGSSRKREGSSRKREGSSRKHEGLNEALVEKLRTIRIALNPAWWKDAEKPEMLKDRIVAGREWGVWKGRKWEFSGEIMELRGLEVEDLDEHISDIWSLDLKREVGSDNDLRLDEKENLPSEHTNVHTQNVALMSLWNRFKEKYNLLADHQVEGCLIAFTRAYRAVIRRLLLENMLFSHMDGLHKRGLIDKMGIIAASEALLLPGGSEEDYPVLRILTKE